jgi:hypothetical protein
LDRLPRLASLLRAPASGGITSAFSATGYHEGSVEEQLAREGGAAPFDQ